MKKILGFEVIEQVEGLRGSSVYRVKQGDGDGTLIVKLLKAKYPSLSGTARFFQEYSVIQSMELRGIIKPLDVRRHGEAVALILEDFDGISLRTAMDSRALGLRTFLEIALQLSDTIGNLHQEDIIHKNIKPSSIILNPENGKVKLTDFGAINELTHENEEIYDVRVIREYLAYLSPEQTGRMNRTLDYRTDLYSLGIVFYEMLTGRVPFESDDPLGVIYSHIARKAVPPVELDSSIPKPISDIVMKLISKTAEDRYQNGFGLRFDLQKCFDQLDHNVDIKPFELGQRDMSVKFHIPEKLVGRDHETGLLMSAFDRASQGDKEVMLVSGHPGIGKTALVNEIHKLIVEKKGYFISGKCERLRKDLPYSSIVGAFQKLVRHVLKENRERIDIWKKALLKALGTQGKVITDVIPEIELIVGKQTDVMELNPEEAQNRFNRVFTNFTRACATENHPLALFLDDLQWTDSASLHLIENIVTDPNIRFLFLIGAYRDDEVAASHPLNRTVEQMQDKGVHVHDIHLSPLNASHVNSIMFDLLKTDLERSFRLSKIIHTKTGGNPFFTKQFVETLYEEGLLKLDPAMGWQWDIDKIRQMQLTDNVVDLMVGRITRLPENTRKMLEVCACIGSRFDLETLSGVLGKSIESTLSDVNDAVSQGLVNASDDAYMFHHDRIQEAAYSLISEDKKPQVHYRIGRIVLNKTNEAGLKGKIYFIVNQLNLGLKLLHRREQHVELARLNLGAGLKAKTSAAYEAADRFLNQAIDLLPHDVWETEYDLALRLHLESGEVRYLKGNQDGAEKCFDLALNKAQTALDKAKVYEIKIPTYTASHRYEEALQLGRQALTMFSVSLPLKPTRLHLLKELVCVKLNMRNRSVKELINLPELTDPHKLATARILILCTQPSAIAKPEFLVLIVLKLLNLTLKNGNSSYAAYAYAAYAAVLCGKLGKINQGYPFGKLALRVLKKFDATELKCKVYFLLGNYVNHWKKHARGNLEYFAEAIESGLKTGADLPFTSYAIVHYPVIALWSGETVREATLKLEKYYEDIKRRHQLRSIQFHELWYQLVLNLGGNVEDKLNIKGDLCDEDKILPEWVSANNATGIAYYTVAKQLILYLYGAFEEALEITHKGKKYMDGMVGSMLMVEHFFYESLALLAHYAQLGKYKQKKGMKRVRANQKKMRKWAAQAPENFASKYVLIEAEMARMGEGDDGTTQLYDKSIALAKKNDYLLEEAIANELAAKFCLSKGMKEAARGYMQEAHYGFDRWGAKLKVKDLEEEYPDFLQQSVEGKPIACFGQLDYAAIVSSLQAISTEIILEDLLKKLMRIVIENAGAERGFFLSLRNDDLYIEAKATIGHDEVVVPKPIPIQARDDLALSVPNYVRQTMNVVVLDDAAKDGDFASDRYVRHHEPKSILCLPVVRQSKLVGILYLENNIATGAFTPDRIEVLKLLASQAAISIENARLYDDVVRNERELRVSEEKYRTILESIEDGYYEVDRSGNFTIVNDSLCRILGYSKNELIGMNYRELMDEKNAHQIYETFKRVLNTREAVKGFDNEFMRRDGVRINNELSVSLVQTTEGQEIGFRGIVRDITKRKKISEELRMHRDHLEELVKERTIEVTKANEQLKREIEARVLAEEELMSYRDHLEELVLKRTAQLTAANEQLRQEIKDRMSAEQEAKLRQEQLFQAAKMASLGTLVSGVAHEINNPISSVMLNAPILQKAWRGVKPILDDHCRVDGEFRIANMSYEELGHRIPLLLSGIVEGAQRVKTIVNDLREFSRQSPSELIDMVDLNEATKAAIGLVFNLIKKTTNHFSVDYESNMPSIKGNTQRIEQVLINLLVNACQSLGDNQKSISVSTTHDNKLDCAVVEIRDQGRGMSSEELERIKDPFFTTKRDTGGTGLGLAISDRIVSDHGGKLIFDSTMEAGTTVKVFLPVSSQKQLEVESQNGRNA